MYVCLYRVTVTNDDLTEEPENSQLLVRGTLAEMYENLANIKCVYDKRNKSNENKYRFYSVKFSAIFICSDVIKVENKHLKDTQTWKDFETERNNEKSERKKRFDERKEFALYLELKDKYENLTKIAPIFD